MKLSFSNIASIILITVMLLGIVSTSHAADELPNPLGASNMTILDLIVRVLQILLGAVSAFALAMFVWGGLVMITSGGNQERVKKAKDTLLWAVLGLAIILFSWTITQYIFENFDF